MMMKVLVVAGDGGCVDDSDGDGDDGGGGGGY